MLRNKSLCLDLCILVPSPVTNWGLFKTPPFLTPSHFINQYSLHTKIETHLNTTTRSRMCAMNAAGKKHKNVRFRSIDGKKEKQERHSRTLAYRIVNNSAASDSRKRPHSRLLNERIREKTKRKALTHYRKKTTRKLPTNELRKALPVTRNAICTFVQGANSSNTYSQHLKVPSTRARHYFVTVSARAQFFC